MLNVDPLAINVDYTSTSSLTARRLFEVTQGRGSNRNCLRAVADAGWKSRGAKTIEKLICMKI
jgi:hypothetical protein